MFGYVRPSQQRLSEADKQRFGAIYCGLCRTLSTRCGTAARFTSTMTLRSLRCSSRRRRSPEILRRGCLAHPIQGRDYCPESEALALAADCSVILAWWQIQDGIRDSAPVKRGKYGGGRRPAGGLREGQGTAAWI